jgi:hypothetical protein
VLISRVKDKCNNNSIFKFAKILGGGYTFSVFYLSNGHSPQIRQNGELLARMCRGESHFSQRWRMSDVSECIESGEMVGECRANVSSPGKVGRPMSAQAR